jgi:FAD synthase
VEITSKVIHGKGIAKKELGFPTANLQLDEAA